MNISFKHQSGDVVYVVIQGHPTRATVKGYEGGVNKNNHWCTYLLEYNGGSAKIRDSKIYTDKLECVKEHLGVKGDFDEALI